MTFRIGIDLGGTKTEIAALDDRGDIVGRLRVPTPGGDYQATLGALAGLVDRIEAPLGIAGKRKATIGIGTPGSLSPVTGLLRNANSGGGASRRVVARCPACGGVGRGGARCGATEQIFLPAELNGR